MIRTSETIDLLSDGFAKAQAKFGAAIKASQNPAFRSKYADLASVIDATLEHLNAEGIGVMQHPALEFHGEAEAGREAFVMVTTRLQHKSGQWMESDVTIPAVMRDRFDAQSVGSAITYACRYALRSICTVPQEDDDANAATGRGTHEDAQGVAKAKIEAVRASKAQQGPSETPPQLTVVQVGEDGFRVEGAPEAMNSQKEALLMYGKRTADKKAVVMDAEGLDKFRHVFVEERGGILTTLKAMQ
jgi:hypothetical protein